MLKQQRFKVLHALLKLNQTFMAPNKLPFKMGCYGENGNIGHNGNPRI